MAKQTLENEVEKWREVFNLFDKDGDGSITSVEVESVMRSLGYEPSRQQLDAMMKKVDKDGNGIIDFNEFVEMMIKKRKEKKKEQEEDLDYRAIFNEFDEDGNGYITATELQSVMARMGLRMSGSEIRQMMSEADGNSDGKISYEEFVRVLSSS